MDWPPNGCELSGRGSLSQVSLRLLLSSSAIASGAASPARSSELLCGPGINERLPPKVRSLAFSRQQCTKSAKALLVTELAGRSCLGALRIYPGRPELADLAPRRPRRKR